MELHCGVEPKLLRVLGGNLAQDLICIGSRHDALGVTFQAQVLTLLRKKLLDDYCAFKAVAGQDRPATACNISACSAFASSAGDAELHHGSHLGLVLPYLHCLAKFVICLISQQFRTIEANTTKQLDSGLQETKMIHWSRKDQMTKVPHASFHALSARRTRIIKIDRSHPRVIQSTVGSLAVFVVHLNPRDLGHGLCQRHSLTNDIEQNLLHLLDWARRERHIQV
mmetsp:Transcript_64074/g.171454  ORF Transcript_64074/g.171454 Transcript_64074/m.171454 type:complete len:225 (+) Transcript_64074:5139-5813(+)